MCGFLDEAAWQETRVTLPYRRHRGAPCQWQGVFVSPFQIGETLCFFCFFSSDFFFFVRLKNELELLHFHVETLLSLSSPACAQWYWLPPFRRATKCSTAHTEPVFFSPWFTKFPLSVTGRGTFKSDLRPASSRAPDATSALRISPAAQQPRTARQHPSARCEGYAHRGHGRISLRSRRPIPRHKLCMSAGAALWIFIAPSFPPDDPAALPHGRRALTQTPVRQPKPGEERSPLHRRWQIIPQLGMPLPRLACRAGRAHHREGLFSSFITSRCCVFIYFLWKYLYYFFFSY